MRFSGTALRHSIGVVAAVTVLTALSDIRAEAANAPCSGMKGGIAGCRGETFLCDDGSVSASKRSCTAYAGGGVGLLGGGTSNMAPASNGECPCRGGSYCIGPRGGRFCTTDSGSKSYLRN
jgi:hypothetical protein